MKVYKSQGPIMQPPTKTISKNGAGEGDFKKIMESLITRAEKVEKVPGREEMGPVEGGVRILHGVERSGDLSSVCKTRLVGELQETLDLVDFYASKLADSTIPSSELTPLISHLEGRLHGLRDMESAPGTPGTLKPLMSDLVITIGSEIAKFKRGDYE